MRYALLTSLLFTMASADVMYEMDISTSGFLGLGDNTISLRHFIKGDRSRSEMKTTNAIVGVFEETIIGRLDRGVMWRLDPAAQEYTETSLAVNEGVAERAGAPSDSAMVDLQLRRTGATKDILDNQCVEFALSFSTITPEGPLQVTQTMWVPCSLDGYDEIYNFAERAAAATDFFNRVSLMGMEQKLFAALKDSLKTLRGLPLEMDACFMVPDSSLTRDTLLHTHSVVRNYAVVPITDMVFDLPADYHLREE